MSKIHCEVHGFQDETFVCQHIVRGFAESTPYGFWYAADSDQERPDAWCTLCEELVAGAGGEWTEEVLAVAQVKLLCGKCYDLAKAMNIESN